MRMVQQGDADPLVAMQVRPDFEALSDIINRV